MWGSLDIPTSGMVAQRVRLEAIASNIANRDAILDAEGNYSPYRMRAVEFAPGDPGAGTPSGREMGVHVAQIAIREDALRPKYDPTSPYADAAGYVMMPDIDPIVEQVNALEATRAYEANVVAAEAMKSTLAQALRLLA
ncbi:MAG TPA: flagellar basal body rod protein FlgC [Phycisphaerales bacterium]|nr:flagellar basal body rod protein FlgC [Phycisphaerales bacterium]